MQATCCGLRRCPGEAELAAPAHADQGRPLRQPVLLRKKSVPGVPHPVGLQVGVGRDIGDMETPPEQFNFRLRLVVPVTSPPRPGIAGRQRFRSDHDAAPLPLYIVAATAYGLDGHGLFVEEEIVAVEPVPIGLRAVEGRVGIRPGVGRPDGADRILVTQSSGTRRAGIIGEVPADVRRAYTCGCRAFAGSRWGPSSVPNPRRTSASRRGIACSGAQTR